MVRKHTKHVSELNSANIRLVLVLLVASCIAAFFIYKNYTTQNKVPNSQTSDFARSAAIERLVPGQNTPNQREKQLQSLQVGPSDTVK